MDDMSASSENHVVRLKNFGKSRRVRIAGIILIVFFIIFSIVGFFVLPPYLKKTAMAKISEQIGRQVSIEAVTINPYTWEAAVKGFEIKESDGKTPFITFSNLYVNIQFKSIFKAAPVFKEIRLDKPYLHLVRTAPNLYNFSDIIDKVRSAPSAPQKKEPSKPFYFLVKNIRVVDGNIQFDDRPVSTKHTIDKINLTVPFISDLPAFNEAFVEPYLSAIVNGTPFNFKGASKVFSNSRETSFDISFRDIDIPHYLAYAPAQLNINVPSGKLDILMKLAYRQFADRSPILVLTGETKARDLIFLLKKENAEFLRIPSLGVRDISFDLDAHRIEIGSISTEKGWLAVSRSADRHINLASLVAGKPPANAAPQEDEAPAKPSAWTVLLKSLAVDGYTLNLSDKSNAMPFGVTVDEISCKIDNLSTAKDSKSSLALSMKVDHRGSIAAQGDFGIEPVSADLSLDVKNLPLKPAQPYLAERLKAILASGALNVNGKISTRQADKDQFRTSFKGKLWVNRFILLDKANAEDLLKWDTLYMGEMDINYAPLTARIREISLTNPYSRIIVNANRTLNLQEVFVQDEKQQESGQTAPSSKPDEKAGPADQQKTGAKKAQRQAIRIDKVTVQGGTVNLTDNSVNPRFSGNMLDIGGRISGLSSEENKFGDVELRGKYDKYAPLEITGRINPLRDDLYVDLKADFKDMDLTPVSPYSGRYAGYTIQKGKLSFRLEYLIVKNKLDAKNNIFLDQFNFGESVESPEATKLPVRLAVALLKDRNGQIKLDIPVSGYTDDPKFSLGGIILKIIINLLVKAATSPFALLGAIFGGGEQLSYAEFDYGSASLTPDTIKKLDTLGKALNDRPALKMDISGHFDAEKDREGLKQFLLSRKVKAQKVKELAKGGTEIQSVDEIKVTDQEYPEYLKRAYKQEKFPKPRNFIGIAKDIPAPEMEKLILTNTTVSEEDLKTLATSRAQAVRNYLVQSSKVDPERIFIAETKATNSEKKEGLKSSRTDFKLK
ncbi:MAG TPA: DUF748 domain-containing protein [Dissulfurispiraceae bacterium]|nr:DUF748 domain-containing protein [Dissulfurispiraceae bacterium]